MAPRLDALVEEFRDRLRHPEPGEDPSAVARSETLEIARWFEENERGFLAEAIACLGDGLLRELKALGVDGQFGSVMLGALDEARSELARRLGEVREEAGV